MSIENVSIVDFSGVDKTSGNICLTISDHLEWKDDKKKQELLVAKLEAYVRFIDSGQVYEAHPNHKGQKVSIVMCCLHAPPPKVAGRLVSIRNQLCSHGVDFRIVIGPFPSGHTRHYEFQDA